MSETPRLRRDTSAKLLGERPLSVGRLIEDRREKIRDVHARFGKNIMKRVAEGYPEFRVRRTGLEYGNMKFNSVFLLTQKR